MHLKKSEKKKERERETHLSLEHAGRIRRPAMPRLLTMRARMRRARIFTRAELRENARRFVLTTVNARNGERDVTLDDR